MLAAAAPVAEVVQIQRPDHAAPEVEVLDQARLAPDFGHVVVRDPLVGHVGVGADTAVGVAGHGPAPLLDALAYLQKVVL